MLSTVKPHVLFLGLIAEAPFPMGRNLLAEVITGQETDRIKRLRLDKLVHHASLPLYQKEDVFSLIDILLRKKFIEYDTVKQHMKVLVLTDKGGEELKEPQAKLSVDGGLDAHYDIAKVTEEDRELFEKLPLNNLSDEQKKAVVLQHPRILCVAGAGTGKTRVLTKRAWFLANFKSVPDEKILCITFTRKARTEMRKRLDKMMPENNIQVETFNSFCESILREHEEDIYDKHMKVMTYSHKIKLVMKIFEVLDLKVENVLRKYYTSRQMHSKEQRTLFFGFVNDIFSVLDYQRNNSMSDEQLYDLIELHDDATIARIVVQVLQKVKAYKEKRGLRDFTDQLVHVLDFFEGHEAPEYEHILVDEYQDINSLQYELLQKLQPKNLFAVGDPRQAIYGWRGAVIDYILDFEQLHGDTKVLQLARNYRSQEEIVRLSNTVIKNMKLPDLIPHRQGGDAVTFIQHDDEDAEALFLTHSIPALPYQRNRIFVLARTNKQIENVARQFDQVDIKYLKRTVEEKNAHRLPAKDEVTLSTIHAIKGLEADVVYLIGANNRYHPIKAGEHPLLETVKADETYDKFEEELRLFYVAVTRAKEKLIVNYTGTITSYLEGKQPDVSLASKSSNGLYEELRHWRYDESDRQGVPPYRIFNDKTLQELCELKPLSRRELEEIHGFGPYKVRQFGSRILEIIRQYP